jgi:hypothetical protein
MHRWVVLESKLLAVLSPAFTWAALILIRMWNLISEPGRYSKWYSLYWVSASCLARCFYLSECGNSCHFKWNWMMFTSVFVSIGLRSEGLWSHYSSDILLKSVVGAVAMSNLSKELFHRTSDHRPLFQSDYKCGTNQGFSPCICWWVLAKILSNAWIYLALFKRSLPVTLASENCKGHRCK